MEVWRYWSRGSQTSQTSQTCTWWSCSLFSPLASHFTLQTGSVWYCLFSEIICTTQVSPHRSLLQSWNFVIWDQLRANTTIIAVTSQPCNQSEIILRMHRAKQWRPTNRIFLIDPSPPLLRERPACSVPAFQSDSDFGLSSTVLLQRPPEERRRESETDSRRLLWYCVVHPLCTASLYSLLLPTGVGDKRWKFQRMNFYANLPSKSSNINFTATQMLLEVILA